MSNRILVLRGGALGDFLVTLPALGLLRARWPAARIELVGNPRAAELGMLGGYLDAVHSQHDARWSALYSDAPLPPALAAWLGEFDLLVNYWADPDGTLVRRLQVRPGQTIVAGTAVPVLAPAARHFCEPLRALGLSTEDFRSRLEVTRDFHQAPAPAVAGRSPRGDWRVAEKSFYTTAVHPGSGSVRKNWPPERWIELIGRLDRPILLVLGEAELGTWNAPLLARLRSADGGRVSHGNRRQDASSGGIEIAANRSLPELATALAGCRRFIGHDSGVSHLAAAVGTPAVLLFGPTDPAMWAPPGGHVRVIHRGPAIDAISVEEVLGACRASPACS
jgi:ADP-heptose:LPS heptosyltransferase